MSEKGDTLKIPNETKWATLGRAIADYSQQGRDIAELIEQAAILRKAEHAFSSRAVAFAALARQLGDAARSGRDTALLVARLCSLRRSEVTGAVEATPQPVAPDASQKP